MSQRSYVRHLINDKRNHFRLSLTIVNRRNVPNVPQTNDRLVRSTLTKTLQRLGTMVIGTRVSAVGALRLHEKAGDDRKLTVTKRKFFSILHFGKETISNHKSSVIFDSISYSQNTVINLITNVFGGLEHKNLRRLHFSAKPVNSSRKVCIHIST